MSSLQVISAKTTDEAESAGRAAAALESGWLFVQGSAQDREPLLLPDSVVRVLREALEHLARGNAVTIAPLHAELTTQEAADLLNVSRPYLIELLDTGRIPHRRVGNRRRVRLSEVLRYRDQEDVAARERLQELADEAQRLHLGY